MSLSDFLKQPFLGLAAPSGISYDPAPVTPMSPDEILGPQGGNPADLLAALGIGGLGPAAPAAPAEAPAETVQSNPNLNNRRGLFGIRGTGRDVLGILGDAFRAQAGLAPMYQPRRDQERQADALHGFAEDPMAAIDRLTERGFADPARTLYNDYVQNQARQAQARAATQEYNRNGFVNGLSFLGTAGDDQESWASARAATLRAWERAGVEPPFEIPEQNPGPEWIDQALRAGMNPYQQSQDEHREVRRAQIGETIRDRREYQRGSLADRRTRTGIQVQMRGIAQQRADAYDRSVDRPRGGRRQRPGDQGGWMPAGPGSTPETGAAVIVVRDVAHARSLRPGTLYRRPGDPQVYRR